MKIAPLKVSMISALAKNRVIGGEDGGIPWHLPRDSRHFRNYTAGKFMLLGRVTYEEMDGWFTTQTPIILTRSADYDVTGGFVASSVEEAIEIARNENASELVVSGGASIYEAAIPFAEELNLTFVDAEIEGGRHFPDWENHGKWEMISEDKHEADAENEFAMRFVVLRKS